MNASVGWFYKTHQKSCLSGSINEDLNFEYGEGATAEEGCGVVFKGEYFYFGGIGSTQKGQVSSTE